VPAWLAALSAAVVGVTLLGAAPLQAQDPDLSWPPNFYGPGNIGFTIEDSWLLTSAIRVASPGDQPVCTSLDDPGCVGLAARYGWWILRVAPPCQQALAWEECVDRLSIRVADGDMRELDFIGTAPGPSFAPDAERGLPTGSTMSLFRDPEDPTVRYAAYLGGQMTGMGRPFTLGDLAAQVIPYRTVPNGRQPGGGQCLFSSGGQCSYRVPFADQVTVELAVKLSNRVTGWLGGRLVDPTIDVTPVSGNLNLLTVTAGPVDVPLVSIAIPDAQATPEILEYWRKTFTCAGNVPCTSGVGSSQSSGPHGVDMLRLFADFLGDTATRVIPTWSVSNLPQLTNQPCLSDRTRLVGLVTTNSTVYSAAPPAFTGGSLRYQVAALHRVPGGEVFSGSYDLVLRSDSARCLYGFSQAPVRADISVTSEDGSQQVATTTVSERDGWIRLAARNFTFSAPTIEVKLSQEQPARVRLMCVKVNPKVKGPKKVAVIGTVAEPPKCPKGYRRR
jgi:hypothetical protein